jgi:hypothetical protein
VHGQLPVLVIDFYSLQRLPDFYAYAPACYMGLTQAFTLVKKESIFAREG